MSARPDLASANGTIEIDIYDTHTKKSVVASIVFGPKTSRMDPESPDFWEEFGDRYGKRFKDIGKIDPTKLEEEVFTDLWETKNK